jgi:hypothetical protein
VAELPEGDGVGAMVGVVGRVAGIVGLVVGGGAVVGGGGAVVVVVVVLGVVVVVVVTVVVFVLRDAERVDSPPHAAAITATTATTHATRSRPAISVSSALSSAGTPRPTTRTRGT